MTIFESTTFEISREIFNFAKEIAAQGKDEFSRKRIYESVICMQTLADYFKSEGYNIDTENGLYKILPVNEEIEINEFRCGGRCIDVRPIVNGKYILIPKSVYKYGILPDLYAVANYHPENFTVNFLGCIEPLEVDKQRQNEKYFIMDSSQLIQPFQIEDRIKLVKNVKISDQNHDLYASYFIDYCDGVLSEENKKSLFKHLFECRGCREKFIQFLEYDAVAKNASLYPEIIQDQMLNIVGAADVNNEKYKDFKEITLEVDKEPDEYEEDEEENEISKNIDESLNVLYGSKSPNNDIFNSFNQKSQVYKQKKPKSMLESVMAEIPKIPTVDIPAVPPVVVPKIDINVNKKQEDKAENEEKRINPELYKEDYSDGIKEPVTKEESKPAIQQSKQYELKREEKKNISSSSDEEEFDYIEDIVTPEPDPAIYNEEEDKPLFFNELNPNKQQTSAVDEMLLLDEPVSPDIPEFAKYIPSVNNKIQVSDDEDVIVVNDDDEDNDYEKLGNMIGSSFVQRFPDIENETADIIIDDDDFNVPVIQNEGLNKNIEPHDDTDAIIITDEDDNNDDILLKKETVTNNEFENEDKTLIVPNKEIIKNEIEQYEDVNEDNLVHFDVEDIDIKDEHESEYVTKEEVQVIKPDEKTSEIELVSDLKEDTKNVEISLNSVEDNSVTDSDDEEVILIEEENSNNDEIFDGKETEVEIQSSDNDIQPEKDDNLVIDSDDNEVVLIDDEKNNDDIISDGIEKNVQNESKNINTKSEEKSAGLITDIPGLDALNNQLYDNEAEIIDITSELANGKSLLDDFSNDFVPVVNNESDVQSPSVENILSGTDNDLSLNLDGDILLNDSGESLDLFATDSLPDIPLLEDVGLENNNNTEINANISENNVTVNENEDDEDDEIILIEDDDKNSEPSITSASNDDDFVILEENDKNVTEVSSDNIVEENPTIETGNISENSVSVEEDEDDEIVLINDDEEEDNTVFMRPASVVDLNDFNKIEEDIPTKENSVDEIDDDITVTYGDGDEEKEEETYQTSFENTDEEETVDNDSYINYSSGKSMINAEEPTFEENPSTSVSSVKAVRYDENGFEIEDEDVDEDSQNESEQSDVEYDNQNEEFTGDEDSFDNDDYESDEEEFSEESDDDESEYEESEEETDDESEDEDETADTADEGKKSLVKKAVIIGVASLILLSAAGGGIFYYMNKAKQEQMQNMAALNDMNVEAPNLENADNGSGAEMNPDENSLQLPEDGENANLAKEMPPQESAAVGEEKLPPPPAPEEQKPVANPEQSKAKDMNQAMTNAFSDNPSALKITKTSWAVAPYIASDADFKVFLQTSGRAIQTQIKRNLASVKDNTYSENTKVQISFASGSVSDVTISKSSGSKQIDDIVLQSVKEYMSTAQMPKLSETAIQAIKKANGSDTFKITFSVNF